MIWLAIMIAIWLFLLGWARILTGHFSPVEIAMTLIVGAGCLCGIGVGFRWRTTVRPATAFGVAALFAALQVLALRLSLLPYIRVR